MSNNTCIGVMLGSVLKLFLPVLCRRVLSTFIILFLVSNVSLFAYAEEQDKQMNPSITDPGVTPSEVETPGEQVQQNSIINSCEISLKNIDDAAHTFISLYNNLLPVSTEKDSVDICRELATDDFMSQCKVLLNKRVKFLSSLPGLTGAQFPEGTITVNEELKYAVDVKWKEILIFGKIIQPSNRHIRLFYSKVKDTWKVRKIDELI